MPEPVDRPIDQQEETSPTGSVSSSKRNNSLRDGPRFFSPAPVCPIPLAQDPGNASATPTLTTATDPSHLRTKRTRIKRSIPRAPRRSLLMETEPFLNSGNRTLQGPSKRFHTTPGLSQDGVELQIEGLSPFVCRTMMFLWYAALVIATALQPLDFLSWRLLNVCGEDAPDLREYEQWNSSCVTKEPMNGSHDLYTVRWDGGPYPMDINDHMLRFRNLVLSLRSPNDWTESHPHVRTFTVRVAIPFVVEAGNLTSLPLRITCDRSSERCRHADIVPNAVLNTTGVGTVSLTLHDVPGSIARRIEESSVGILLQRRAYSIGVLAWRYTFLVISLLHFMRFTVNKKYTIGIYEQAWVVALQIVFIWYLNPLAALYISVNPSPLPLNFLEFHVPWWFMAMLVSFMFSVITASMPRTLSTGRKYTGSRMSIEGIRDYFCRCRNIYDPPLWTKLVAVSFIIVAVVLDVVVAWRRNAVALYKHEEGWGIADYILGAHLIFGGLVCCAMLYHISRNIGKKSYLDSRPQQLACRVFILMFVTAIVFNIYQFIMFATFYLSIPGMSAWQPLIQLPALMVWTVLVNSMTLIYTTRRRSGMVPVHPRDTRWKLMVWPDTWYRWLARHGGSMYIFHSEKEETIFNWNQLNFRLRQRCAREKKNPNTTLLRGSTELAETAESVVRGADDQLAGARDTWPHASLNDSHSVAWGGFRDLFFDDDNKVLNMDMTSTCYLPRSVDSGAADALRRGEAPSASLGRSSLGGFSAPPRDLREECARISPTPSQLRERDGNGEKPPPHEPQAGTTPGMMLEPPDVIESQMDPNDEAALRDDENSVNPHPGSRFERALQRARGALGAFVRGAERNLITRPVHAFEQAETYLSDVIQQSMHGPLYLPFFNLETSIDCFNMSLEAYNVLWRPDEKPCQEKVGSSCFCVSSAVDAPAGVHSTAANGPDAATHVGGGPHEENVPNAFNNHAAVDGGRDVVRGVEKQIINVEQYGYRLHAVWKAMRVQVIITEINVDEDIHKGKAPRIIIAFRGTTNMSNTWQNMRAIRVVWDEMMEDIGMLQKLSCCWRPTVHAGYLSIWEAHEKRIHEKLKELLAARPHIVYRVLCTGHSLGGAVASLCAYSVRRMLRQIKYPLSEVTVYTFGQPAIGNSAFRSAYDKAVPRTFRVVNESDVVASIPIYSTHVGIEVHIDRHGNYICKPTFIERLFRPTRGTGFALQNHFMWSYAASLNAIARNSSCEARATTGPNSSITRVRVDEGGSADEQFRSTPLRNCGAGPRLSGEN